MNTANPQLEGLYLAIAAINRLLIQKGVASHDEIREALQAAEATAISDNKAASVSPSHQKAVAFPIRLLLLANEADGKGVAADFEALAKEVGRRT
jgi:hypothetical protein